MNGNVRRAACGVWRSVLPTSQEMDFAIIPVDLLDLTSEGGSNTAHRTPHAVRMSLP